MDRRKKFHISNYKASIDKNDTEYWTHLFMRTASDTDIALTTHVRTNIFTEEEFLEFKRAIEANSKTVFGIEKRTFTGRCVWSKGYRCHHGTHNLKPVTVNPRKKTGCSFRVNVRIKVITGSTKRKDPHVSTHPCLIVFEGGHTHAMGTSEQLRVLPLSNSTKCHLEELFRSGLSPSEALVQLSHGKSAEQLADSSIHPSLRLVYHLFGKFKASLSGDQMWALVADLENTLPSVRVAFQRAVPEEDKEMGIAILTPLMSRAHASVPQAADILFVETTSNIDMLNTKVTVLLTWSPVGSVPLGLLLTDCSTVAAYKQGFKLWKSILPETSFFGSGSPKVIITDDCDAERAALSELFPSATLLLCKFSVQRAVWRWLWDGEHGVAKDDRRVLMKLFQTITNAETVDLLHKAVSTLKYDVTALRYSSFIALVDGLLERTDLFTMAFRTTELTQGYDTNNFSEVTMRVLKEVVLERRRAFNAYELAVILAERFEEVLKQRILDVALGRRRVLYNIPDFKSTIAENMILPSDEDANEYIVRSRNNPEVGYSVYASLMLCMCLAENRGKFCEHLAAIEHYYPDSMPVNRTITTTECCQLAMLAVGDASALVGSIFGTVEAPLSSDSMLTPTPSTLKEPVLNQAVVSDEDYVPMNTRKNKRIEKARNILQNLVDNIEENISDPNMLSALEAMDKSMKRITTSSSLISAVSLLGKRKRMDDVIEHTGALP